ncbi:MAG: adenylyltransferase/cytidyltransferase family protein [Candidatus Marinimicrobia bacterium]|nr:adenylyltransferase/cytidyltransferase family protein [Candidatus Neomarinimicrobiota bacterium]
MGKSEDADPAAPRRSWPFRRRFYMTDCRQGKRIDFFHGFISEKFVHFRKMKYVFNTTEWRDLLHLCKKWKADKDRLVFTNGCFDGLHAGHLALLEFARKQGNRLIVGLNSDNSVRELKGKERPQYGADRRAHDILQSGHADAVVIFEERTPERSSPVCGRMCWSKEAITVRKRSWVRIRSGETEEGC